VHNEACAASAEASQLRQECGEAQARAQALEAKLEAMAEKHREMNAKYRRCAAMLHLRVRTWSST
jgi:uncharacterized coiled-coil DUF342 family protein